MRTLLGTYVEIGTDSEFTIGNSAITAAFEVIENVQQKLSCYDQTSELSKVNGAFQESIKISPITATALRLAKYIARASGSAFNFTGGGYLARQGILPNFSSKSILDFGNEEDVELRGLTVRLKRPIQLTLDGIAKGLAVDFAVREMKKNGLTSGWVNAGGDLRVFGELSLPIVRRDEKNNLTDLGSFKNIALATSSVGADQTRFRGHICSDVTIVKEGTWSITAKYAWLADALTKVSCIVNPSERETIIKRLNGTVVIPKMMET